ncbi:hypothetical protein CNMCM5793_002003 [Aspergillus hiratsukae]|uniref:FAD-binding PCMH-type domain-containing protein n=1 Tax=Aspergillus hiratsukae TaxID=1194566 RepID=A0A8H6UEJ8_9EURO|nr:hypothetical protein CNMCM5793_002003 [Aspergillus hiratsukae]
MFRTIAEPFLYSKIQMTWRKARPDPPPPISQLLRTLLSRPQLAAYITNFHLDGDNTYWLHQFRFKFPNIPVSDAQLDGPIAFIRATRVPYSDLWVQELRQGTMDAFVALLLVQLSNLRCLYLAPDFTRQTALVGMVLRSAICEPRDYSLPDFRHLRDVPILQPDGRDEARDKNVKNTSDILPFFYLPSIQRMSASVENPDKFTWPAAHLPVPSKLTSLVLTAVREAYLGELLAVTQNLESLRWHWYYDPSVKDGFTTPIVDLGRIAAAISHVSGTLTDLTISAKCCLGVGGHIFLPGIKTEVSLHAMVNFDMLKRLQVPWPFLVGFAQDTTKQLQDVIPRNIEFLSITDDLNPENDDRIVAEWPPWEWRDSAILVGSRYGHGSLADLPGPTEHRGSAVGRRHPDLLGRRYWVQRLTGTEPSYGTGTRRELSSIHVPRRGLSSMTGELYAAGGLPAAGPKIIVGAGAPAPRTNLGVTNVDHTTVQLSWTASAGAAGYAVYVGSVRDNTDFKLDGKTTATTYGVGFLFPGTWNFRFCVSGFNGSVLFFFSLQLAIPIAAGTIVGNDCKITPGSPSWPSQDDWLALNRSVGGNLLAVIPPALVCDQRYPASYNKTSCATVNNLWYQGSFHTNNPISVHWPNFQNDACLPSSLANGTTKCDLHPFPRYTVNATVAGHVAEAVKFAAKTGVRLSVKGTGHDFLGRSTSPGLSIWTHHLREIEVHSSFIPQSCPDCSGASAMTIAAGHVMQDLYDIAKAHDKVIVGGADGSVGIGGLLTGGGHGPISSKFGLAVDNVYQMEVVTPSGDVLTANEYQNADLFWAMRGGGGATFGILTSVTLRTYPVFPISSFEILLISTPEEAAHNNNSNWYSALTHLHSQIPVLSDINATAYYSFGPQQLLGVGTTPNGTSGQSSGGPSTMALILTGWALDQPEDTLRQVLKPIWDKFNSTTGAVSSVTMRSGQNISDVVGVSTGDASASTPTAGLNVVMASRLWDRSALLDTEGVENTFRALQDHIVQGLLIAGPGVRNVPVESASVTPAWRRTYLHLTVGGSFAYQNETDRQRAVDYNTNVVGKLLRVQAPDMGNYVNEANVWEPNYRQDFWGTSYSRLLRIKHKYDPHGVLWCATCVGSEEWSLSEQSGELCRVGFEAPIYLEK